MRDPNQDRNGRLPTDAELAALKRNAAVSLNLARAILGDHEVLRICSAWNGQPATREVRMAMAGALARAVQEKIAKVSAPPSAPGG